MTKEQGITKKTYISLGVVCILLAVVVTMVAATSNQETRLEALEDDWKVAEPRLNEHETRISVIDTKLDTIIENQNEMKQAISELKVR